MYLVTYGVQAKPIRDAPPLFLIIVVWYIGYVNGGFIIQIIAKNIQYQYKV